MKNLSILLFSLIPAIGFAQADQKSINDYTLKQSRQVDGIKVNNYYLPLKNVLTGGNEQDASVIINKALTLRTDSFTLERDGRLLYTAVLHLSPQRVLKVKDLASNEVKTFKLDLEGEIPANRAIELVMNKYDSEKTKTENGYLYFDKKKYKIIENDNIQKRLVALAFPKAK